MGGDYEDNVDFEGQPSPDGPPPISSDMFPSRRTILHLPAPEPACLPIGTAQAGAKGIGRPPRDKMVKAAPKKK